MLKRKRGYPIFRKINAVLAEFLAENLGNGANKRTKKGGVLPNFGFLAGVF
jgi:hypothetical protein